MPDRPNAPPPGSAAPRRSNLGPIIGAVALVGIGAAAAVLYTREASRPQSTQAQQVTPGIPRPGGGGGAAALQ